MLDKKTNVLYGEPLILLDNIPIVDVNELMNIPPPMVERIDVINSTYVYGDHVLRGIVMVKTNTDNFAGIALPVSSTFLEFDAVSTSSGESQTDANSSNFKNPRIPDFRNVLYWNPNVMLDKNENSITFYTSDDEASYDIIVRGVTNDGRFISGNASFTVSGN